MSILTGEKPTGEYGKPRLWTVQEYRRMGTLGLFRPEERTELIHGRIVERPTPTPEHSSAVALAYLTLTKTLGERECYVRTENPISFPGIYNLPQPDVAVVRHNPRRYAGRFPSSEEVLFLAEIAESSENFDRETKAGLYAAADIGEYWIVNLNAQTLEVYRDPQNGVYANTFTLPATGNVSPLAAPQSIVLVADMLP